MALMQQNRSNGKKQRQSAQKRRRIDSDDDDDPIEVYVHYSLRQHRAHGSRLPSVVAVVEPSFTLPKESPR